MGQAAGFGSGVQDLRALAAVWLCHMAFFWVQDLTGFSFPFFCSAGPQAELPTSLCTLSMPSFPDLAQCLAEPKSPQLGAEALFTICPSSLRHPQPPLPGIVSQDLRWLSPTPLTPSSSNKFPSLFSTQLQDSCFFTELHLG